MSGGAENQTDKNQTDSNWRFGAWFKKWLLSLSLKNKIFIVVLFISLIGWFIVCVKGSDETNFFETNDPVARIQQVNMAQSRLCVLKINAKTCLYAEDNMTRLDLTPYKVGYSHGGEVDIVVDLDKARVELMDEHIKIYVPEPHIDEATLKIRPESLRRVKISGGLRTETQRSKIDNKLKFDIEKDLEETINVNFPKKEARNHALIVLKSLYATLGFDNVEIEFSPVNADVK